MQHWLDLARAVSTSLCHIPARPLAQARQRIPTGCIPDLVIIAEGPDGAGAPHRIGPLLQVLQQIVPLLCLSHKHTVTNGQSDRWLPKFDEPAALSDTLATFAAPHKPCCNGRTDGMPALSCRQADKRTFLW